MKKLLVCIFCLSCAALARAEDDAEVTVIYLKDGGVLRGEVVSETKTVGRIQLRDGSIFVYKKKSVKMTQTEPAAGPSAKRDSIKMVKIAQQAIEDDKEKQRQAEARRKYEEQMRLAQANQSAGEKKSEGAGFLMYSTLEAQVGMGNGKLPAVDSATPALDNKNTIVGISYTLGGRADFFAIGVSTGIQQTHRSMAVCALDTAPLPTATLAMPIGWDLRIELARQRAAMAPYLGFSGGYAISLTEGVDSHLMLNPVFGFRFGRKVSSLFSVGLQLNMGDNPSQYLTLRMGVIF